MERVADHAEISRTTAYRYFPNRRLLMTAAHPETTATSLLPEDAPDDPRERLALVVEAFGWIGEALEPLQRQLSAEQLHALVVAIRSAIGIEALVWLTDVAQLSGDDAQALMEWIAQSLLDSALKSPPPTSVVSG